jgi:sarcosine oxidase
LAKQAYTAWSEVEADADEKLIVKTGGLDFTHPQTKIPISDYTESMDAAHVPYEWLDAAEIMARWPQFRLTDDVSALYQAETGIAPAAKCMAAHLRLAQRNGAVLRDKAGVTAVHAHGDEIEIVADDTIYRCRQLIVAAGAWSNQVLANFGCYIPLTVTQEQVVYYNTPHVADFMPDRFPVWIWMDVPCYYGFPVYGENGPKVSEDAGGEEVTADTRSFETNQAYQQRMNDFVQRIMPTAYGPPLLIKTCLYTMPPDRDFVLGTLPDQPNVSVAIGAAHAFKFSSLFGKILSEVAMEGATDYFIEPFRVDRPILQQADPARNFMF